jgi:hypothetical protein
MCLLFARSLSLSLSLRVGVGKRTLGAEELAGDVQGLAAHNDNLLSVEQLLGDGAGEATEEVPLAVDDLNSQVSQSLECDIVMSPKFSIGSGGRNCQLREDAYRVIGRYVR